MATNARTMRSVGALLVALALVALWFTLRESNESKLASAAPRAPIEERRELQLSKPSESRSKAPVVDAPNSDAPPIEPLSTVRGVVREAGTHAPLANVFVNFS